MAAYADDIRLLQTRGGYQSFDLIRLKPNDPERAESRKKFLSEHIHSDDEVRYCIEGQGQFYIRTGDYVHALEVTVGDLISVPAGALHWFNGGEKPSFTAIRLFTTPDGWAATFTGAGLPGNIPLYEGERRQFGRQATGRCLIELADSRITDRPAPSENVGKRRR